MRRHTWSTAWIGRGAGVAAAVGLLAGEAAAQAPAEDVYPQLKWLAREQLHNHANARDEAVDIVYWKDVAPEPDQQWVYATGWVTVLNLDNSVRGTKFATYKYDATYNGPLEATADKFAYFPPGNIQQGDNYKAVAMTVDADGNIYIVGEGPHTAGVANNQDYIVVKYDKELAPVWTGSGTGVGRYYDGTAGGNDIPADIDLTGDQFVVVVTGTSAGGITGDDIATVAWFTGAHDINKAGDRAADGPNYWPDVGWGDGVRRYNFALGKGDDRGVELRALEVDQPGGQVPIQLAVLVLGTSWGGANDDFTTHAWVTDEGDQPIDARFDLGANDTATGLSIQGSAFFSGGYSEIPDNNFGGGDGGGDELDVPQLPIDYSIVRHGIVIDMGGNPSMDEKWRDYRDYAGGPDYSADLVTQQVQSGIHIWQTGEGKTGARRDVFTQHYLDDGTPTPPNWSHGFNAGGSTTFNYGKAIALQPVFSDPALPYITGAVGYTNNDWLLTLKYRVNPLGGLPVYTRHWTKLYSISTFVAGTASALGNGRDFFVMRLRE